MSVDLKHANIFVTGGAGTLGMAIARRRQEEGWKGQLTVFSRDEHKHAKMRAAIRDTRINYVCGNIQDVRTLHNAMAGHNVVIHAGAVKVIPVSEQDVIDTVGVNVTGSLNVLQCATVLHVEHVLGISTDKACSPANAYGATKMLMEKMFQEYSRASVPTEFHLVRYGNVLESNGSVIEMWKKSVAAKQPIKITDPHMTRFWLSPAQAVQYVIDSLQFESGAIYIPKMPALPIGKLAEFVLDMDLDFDPVPPIDYQTRWPVQIISLRPGEKMHESLLTADEGWYADDYGQFYLLYPTTSERRSASRMPYASDKPVSWLTKAELGALLQYNG